MARVTTIRIPLALLGICVATIALTIAELHRGPIYAELGLLAIPVEIAAYFLALASYAALLIEMRESVVAIVIGLAITLVGLASGPVLLAEPGLRAQLRYELERPLFAQVAVLYRAGRLEDRDEVPGFLCYLSADCSLATTPVLFVPDSADHSGFAYDAAALDCHKRELGDGWWWVEDC